MAFKPYCETCQNWHTEAEGHLCECNRTEGQCIKGDLAICPNITDIEADDEPLYDECEDDDHY